jgi:translation initiation factor 2 alpha subunit (eIF-2alpha)
MSVPTGCSTFDGRAVFVVPRYHVDRSFAYIDLSARRVRPRRHRIKRSDAAGSDAAVTLLMAGAAFSVTDADVKV